MSNDAPLLDLILYRYRAGAYFPVEVLGSLYFKRFSQFEDRIYDICRKHPRTCRKNFLSFPLGFAFTPVANFNTKWRKFACRQPITGEYVLLLSYHYDEKQAEKEKRQEREKEARDAVLET
ncbi:MAG: hypothetical protein DRH04_01945 [Deltaproteobacteria bacterium]|nr:MAG: hypothetical protein DRH04_01945 [Deltaproteobacteria bacterium]